MQANDTDEIQTISFYCSARDFSFYRYVVT
jgi:hypothetical protein